MCVDDIIAGALFYNNVLTSSLIHTQIAYATVDHELNSHSNNEPLNSQKIFMSNGHDLTPRYCLERREYCALRPHSDHKRGITVSIQHCTVVVSSDHNSIQRCTLVISSLPSSLRWENSGSNGRILIAVLLWRMDRKAERN